MLYRCGGGYPVGIVVAYVRSPIASRGEPDQTQFFFAVGFDFYGKREWPETHLINTVWERIHNRVTANILNRFKRECEARFRRAVGPKAEAAGSWVVAQARHGRRSRSGGGLTPLLVLDQLKLAHATADARIGNMRFTTC